MSAPRRSKPTRLGDAIAQYLKSAGLSDRVGRAGVVAEWPGLVGERIARAAVAESVSPDGTLFVRVQSSAWRQELSLMTPEVLALLNRDRTAGRIKRIRWLLGTESAEAAESRRPRWRGRR
jgi:predicted nucleic acid-binding Zn ribbon protein